MLHYSHSNSREKGSEKITFSSLILADIGGTLPARTTRSYLRYSSNCCWMPALPGTPGKAQPVGSPFLLARHISAHFYFHVAIAAFSAQTGPPAGRRAARHTEHAVSLCRLCRGRWGGPAQPGAAPCSGVSQLAWVFSQHPAAGGNHCAAPAQPHGQVDPAKN